MRTTVTIDDELLKQARQRALTSGVPLGSVLEDALRLLLAEHHAASTSRDVALPTYGSAGLRPGVDLENKDALNDLLDEAAG